MKEAELSNKACLALRYQGKFCYKTADRFHAGVPDIYIAGGVWIESKIAKVKTSIEVSRLPEPEQRNWARNLINAKDRVFLLVGIYYPEGLAYWLNDFPFEEVRVRHSDCYLSLDEAILSLCNSVRPL